MNQHPDSVLRRWGFYSGTRLAFAATARRAGPRELSLAFIETEHHGHTATLPERIRREQLVRDCVHSDVTRMLGADWKVSVRFEPRKLSEHQLAQEVYGALTTDPVSNN